MVILLLLVILVLFFGAWATYYLFIGAIIILVIVFQIIKSIVKSFEEKKKEKLIAEQTPSIPTYEERISEAKETVKEKALEIKNKMSKITGHLSVIKDMNTKDAKEIYDKEKNILTGLFDYYCKFQKVYSDLCFSQILNLDDVDISEIKKIDVKDFVNKIKAPHKRDYEIAVSSLKKEDTLSIKESYMRLENAVDNLTNTLINIQYNIIV
jgi:hypothetical protein